MVSGSEAPHLEESWGPGLLAGASNGWRVHFYYQTDCARSHTLLWVPPVVQVDKVLALGEVTLCQDGKLVINRWERWCLILGLVCHRHWESLLIRRISDRRTPTTPKVQSSWPRKQMAVNDVF